MKSGVEIIREFSHKDCYYRLITKTGCNNQFSTFIVESSSTMDALGQKVWNTQPIILHYPGDYHNESLADTANQESTSAIVNELFQSCLHVTALLAELDTYKNKKPADSEESTGSYSHTGLDIG